MKYLSYRNGALGKGFRAFMSDAEGIPPTVEAFTPGTERVHSHEEFLRWETAVEVLRASIRNTCGTDAFVS